MKKSGKTFIVLAILLVAALASNENLTVTEAEPIKKELSSLRDEANDLDQQLRDKWDKSTRESEEAVKGDWEKAQETFKTDVVKGKGQGSKADYTARIEAYKAYNASLKSCLEKLEEESEDSDAAHAAHNGEATDFTPAEIAFEKMQIHEKRGLLKDLRKEIKSLRKEFMDDLKNAGEAGKALKKEYRKEKLRLEIVEDQAISSEIAEIKKFKSLIEKWNDQLEGN